MVWGSEDLDRDVGIHVVQHLQVRGAEYGASQGVGIASPFVFLYSFPHGGRSVIAFPSRASRIARRLRVRIRRVARPCTVGQTSRTGKLIGSAAARCRRRRRAFLPELLDRLGRRSLWGVFRARRKYRRVRSPDDERDVRGG